MPEAPLLTLRALRSVAVSVPMRFPLGTSAATVRSAPLLLIDLETEQGITGRTYLFCYMPMGMRLIAYCLDEMFALIKGDPVDPAVIGPKLLRATRLIGAQGIVWMAIAATDILCWDILAQAAGLPLCSYLGSEARPIPAYNSNGLGMMDPEACADEAEKLLEHGFRAVKLRLGYPTLEKDLAAVRAVRKRLPENVLIMTDYNQALSLDEAMSRGKALDSEGLAWIEEPLRHDDYAGCATLSAALSTPIQIGENFIGPHAMESALAARACDLYMPDVVRIGGVTGWRRASELASANGVKISSHLFPEVSAHLLAASPERHWLEFVDWASPILQQPLRVVNGFVTPSELPGSGTNWNTAAVRHYAV